MAEVSIMPTLLFTTFHRLYGISYTLLGTLAVVCFVTQLAIDLIFSFFSHKFNIKKTVRLMPLITILGFVVFAVYPLLFPKTAYVGLVIGTVIFSVSAGLGEVLSSPLIASIPSDNPDHEMSKLHSVYAWGAVFVVVVCTLFINFLNADIWYFLVLGLTVIPIISFVLFMRADIPELPTTKNTKGALMLFKNKQVWLLFFAIFVGGATECTMSQWCSTFIEKALQIDKIWGDLFGVALFALMLGVGRTLYGKYGKNLELILVISGVAAVVCYLVAALSPIPILGLIACALTGISASLMWPGMLTVSEKRVPSGVVMFALMAAGGDLGASAGPQAVGAITDYVSLNFPSLAEKLNLTSEQLGMKAGLLCASILPITALILFIIIYLTRNKKNA